MPFTVPSLRDLRRIGRDFITARLPGSEVAPPNSRLRVMSDQNAGTGHGVYLFIQWLSKQFLPDTAEANWLDRHGEIWLHGRKSATFAEGIVVFSGTVGTVIPNGTRLVADTGVEYETTTQGIVGDIPVQIPIIALTAGENGNQLFGAGLQIETAIVNVSGTASVIELQGGTDQETDESLRERVLFRIRKPPMGGDQDDYVLWSREFPAVSRAWSYPLEMGMGTVTVRFMMDELRDYNDGFPLQQDVDDLLDYLNTLRPVAVKDFFVVAPVPFPVNFTITGLVSDDSETHALIEASVRKMLKDRASPGSTIYRSWLDEAISAASGEDHHELDFVTTAMPSSGHLPILGSITYA